MNRNGFRHPRAPAANDRDCERLARSFDIEGLRLTQTAGVLVMEGRVPCYRMKKLAGAAVARLLGALPVVNRLRVVPHSHRADAELVEAVRAALRARPRLVEEAIAVTAHEGIVALRGNVCSSAARCEAEVVVWAVGGVVDVENQLRVERRPAGNGPEAGGDTSLPAARR